MEQLNFSSWIKEQSHLNIAGDAYFSLSELSKEVIDDAVNRYVEYIKAFSPRGSLNDFDRGFLAGWNAFKKEYEQNSKAAITILTEQEYNNKFGAFKNKK